MTQPSTSSTRDIWEPFRYFLGAWRGTASGAPGEGEALRTYEFILQDRFIRVKNRSEYPPQDRNPEGEVHEDLGILGFDAQRRRFVMREFHVEGYVNQYVLEGDPIGPTFVFVTEAIENFQPGWQARTTYEIIDEHTFRETFDLAAPGKPWVCLITHDFRRA